jgi:glycosyltransferase involved in cell wall biosynthesis
LEAMKSSCPVVCSNTSSMPEVLGECGELVSPREPDAAAAALARILSDPCYADSLRFSALMRSKAFSWGRHVADLARIYDAF